MQEALTRAPFKPATGFTVDPVPAENAQNVVNRIQPFKPATSFNRDPVPARPASSYTGPTERFGVSFDESGEMTWSTVNPVAARSGV